MAVDHRGWDEDILQDLFNERDQQCIRNIQLADGDGQDNVFWSNENSGIYTVRSAYRLIQSQKELWRQEDSNSFWRKFWRIKAPPKVLNMVWRSLTGSLPTMVMLHQKHVPVDRVCPVCKSEEETICHSLVQCPLAAQCWQMVIPGIQWIYGEDLYQWWGRVLQACDNEKRAEVATVCWSIWKARNNLVWNQQYTRVYVVIANAKQYLVQWSMAERSKISVSVPYLSEGDGDTVWAKPQKSQIKVSVDAAIFKEFNASGMGLVARDDKGDLIQAKSVCMQGVVSPAMAEVMAIKEALSWIKDTGWRNVIVESDSLVSIQAIRSKVPMLSPFGRVVMDCRNMFQELFTVSLCFIKRSANMSAHELARVSYSYPGRVFDRLSVPIGVDVALNVDSES